MTTLGSKAGLKLPQADIAPHHFLSSSQTLVKEVGGKEKPNITLLANNPQLLPSTLTNEYSACIFPRTAPGRRCIGTRLVAACGAGQEEILSCLTPAH